MAATRMKFDPDIYHRRSIRLPHFDYSSTAAYFVTICARDRECLFGTVGATLAVAQLSEPTVRLTNLGSLIERNWIALPERHANVSIDEYVIMPNHVHGIVMIGCSGEGSALDKKTPVKTRATAIPRGAGLHWAILSVLLNRDAWLII